MNIEQFKVRGFGDHLLVGTNCVRERWMLFFEADEPYHGHPPAYAAGSFMVFETPNGFHVISENTTPNIANKIIWFEDWKREYPYSDYILSKCNVLAPHSDQEGKFILRVARKAGASEVPQVLYYRDKKVFETWLNLK